MSTPPHPRAPTARTAVAALVAAAACWGIGTVVTKQVVDDVAPLTLLPLQLAASCVFLLVVALVRHEPLAWTPPVRRLAALGVLNPGMAYALGLVGLTTITASMSVLLWALEPVAIMLLAALVLREHIPPALAASVGVAIAGVLLVVYQPGATGDALGITLTLVSIGCCALYSVLTRRLLLDDSSLTVVLAQQAAALVFAVAAGHGRRAVGGTGWDLDGHGAGDWLGAAASGVLYYGLGFWFFVTGLARCRPRSPGRSCRSSRSSGSRPATWSASGSSRGSGSARRSSWPRRPRSPSASVPWTKRRHPPESVDVTSSCGQRPVVHG